MTAWTVLGLPPTADAVAIRRAYARRLKETRPEDDPDGYHRLRAAREAALEDAARRAPAQAPPGEAGPEAAEDRAEPSFGAAPPDASAPLPASAPRETSAPSDVSAPSERVPAAEPDRAVSRPDPRLPRVSVLDDGGQVGPGRTVVLDPRVEVAGPAQARDGGLGPALDACLAPLRDPRGTPDVEALTRVLRAAAELPRDPRLAIETRCLAALAAGFRDAGGTYDPAFARRVRPLLVAADRVFGWAQDDAPLTDALSPRDADTVILLLNESAREAEPSSGLRAADAKALFEAWPSYAGLRAAVTRPGAVPRRPRAFAFLMPHLWALRHRLWGPAALIYGVLALPATLALVTLDDARFDALLLLPGAALTLAVGLAVGLSADRILAAAARRSVRRANARGLFDRGERDRHLKRVAKPFRPNVLIVFYVFGAATFFPYLGLAVILGWALGLD